ncbi:MULTISPECIES: succinate dehydrogenase cytochrome b subunit [unclassified Flavobacterium]|uniref:succinate dehydrogenase cytochrome b subunit n=1 Tax=unclassified Flavobacterium TaxID=196869 RepID=UPI001F12E350|nr:MULTISPECIES: succinate dehydrogenase cytochrome b subunit [unclassified Flavobacterium]UMY66213.1 succinate dehydrogenase cytochrome b subunit [Flavobacterium sp. HJ-32-4]
MAKSALLKSSLAKKYWMGMTGLFLCLFLVGHLLGNLQILYADAHQFNAYALFMTTNPAVKVLSYLTYFSILFHAVDGLLLTIQNAKARPVGYVKNNPSQNSTWSSRNMGLLGTLLLVFIVTHMMNFWAVMHFDDKMPLEKFELVLDKDQMMPGQDLPTLYTTTNPGVLVDSAKVGATNEEAKKDRKTYYVEDRTKFMYTGTNVQYAEGYKDLYAITIAFFKDKSFGLVYTLLYVLAMAVLAFHLDHGFASGFQSLGVNHPKWSPLISAFGRGFAILVPLAFAIIPLCVHFDIFRTF